MPHALQPYSLACHQKICHQGRYVIKGDMSLKEICHQGKYVIKENMSFCHSVFLYILSLKLLISSACFVF